MKHCLCAYALFLGLGAAPCVAEEAGAAAEAVPLLSGTLELVLAGDRTLASPDAAGDIGELRPEAALFVTLSPVEWLGFDLGLTFEPVLDLAESRLFGDLGLYADTLAVRAGFGDFSMIAGKFAPGFGTAWDRTPGIYATELVEDYELTEMIGGGISGTFETGALGRITAGANLFFADTTFLSDSAFTRRGRLSLADGGPGNTGRPDNLSVTLDGSDMPALPGLSWHLGYVHLAAGSGDLSDVDGFAAGLAHETGLSGDVVLTLNGEAAYFSGFDGADDEALYLTGGLSLAHGPWHGELAATLRRTDESADGVEHVLLTQISAGHAFANGIDLSAGYAFVQAEGVTGHLVGLRLTKTFEFEIGR
jgi:hypothetical protein